MIIRKERRKGKGKKDKLDSSSAFIVVCPACGKQSRIKKPKKSEKREFNCSCTARFWLTFIADDDEEKRTQDFLNKDIW